MSQMARAYCGRVRTRYAPTPSGYLHIGNAANFVATNLLATEYGAEIILRIDDVDAERVRNEYVEDIFDLLEWLDLSWNIGPTCSADLDSWSQTTRVEKYRGALQVLADIGAAYVCACSRSQWQSYEGQECPGGCRGRDWDFQTGRTAWRLRYPSGPDPVLWRRDDVPAYHLTSVVDDDLWQVDLVVRGADLIEATHLQRYLSSVLSGSTFQAARVLHHRLIVDEAGRKLSKSAGMKRSPLARTQENRAHIIELAAQFVSDVSRDLPRSSGS